MSPSGSPPTSSIRACARVRRPDDVGAVDPRPRLSPGLPGVSPNVSRILFIPPLPRLRPLAGEECRREGAMPDSAISGHLTPPFPRPAGERVKKCDCALAKRGCTGSSWWAAGRRGWSSSPGSATASAGGVGRRLRWSNAPAPIYGSHCCTKWPRGALDPGEYEVNYLAQAHWHGFRYRFGEMIGLDQRRQGGAPRRHL